MSRGDLHPHRTDDSRSASVDQAVGGHSAQTAQEIATAALELAKRARAAGLTGVGYLLETVALQASVQAGTPRRPADVSGR